jgi:hypothetical protein
LRDADAAGDDDAFETELFDEENAFLNDEDFVQLKEYVEEGAQDDEEFLESLINDEDML